MSHLVVNKSKVNGALGIFRFRSCGYVRLIVSIAFILLILGSYGCTQEPINTHVKDGKTFGTVAGSFRNRWWNYYERGLSFADGGFFKEAAADLQEAIRQRDKDQRMARTYGMHFVDYFPHREMGIIYFEMGTIC